MFDQKFYLKNKEKDIAEAENSFDVLPCKSNDSQSSYFLKKMREIIFCRLHGRPTEKKEKSIRAYRDFEVRKK